MKRIFIILIGLISVAQAQHISGLGRYSIPYEKGCAPVTISVSVLDNFGNVPRTYIYETGQIDVTDTFYTFQSPGTYQIVQINGEDIEQKTDTLIFEVVEPTPPTFEIYKCSSTSVVIEITDTYYDYYVVKYSSNDSTVYFPGDQNPIHDYGATNGNVQVIGYFDDSYPNCGDSFEAFTIGNPIPATINSSSITEGCQLEYFIDLNTSSDPMTKYTVSFRQSTSTDQLIFEGRLRNSLSIPITLDPLLSDYCVSITPINACDGSLSGSPVENCDSFSSSDFLPLGNSYASYNSGNDIEIYIENTNSKSITINRSYGDSSSFTTYSQVQGNFSDPIGSHFRPYYYELLLEDTCGNSINRAVVSAPYLRIIDKDAKNNKLSIEVSEPVNVFSSFTATLIVFNNDSSLSVELPYEDSFTIPAGLGENINLTVRFEYPEVSVYSNTVSTTYETIVFIPKAFTPNGDGFNDSIELFGLPDGPFEITIFNRWGKPIHRIANQNPIWDGKINDKLSESGTYQYKLTFTLPDGNVKTQVGTFVLLKPN